MKQTETETITTFPQGDAEINIKYINQPTYKPNYFTVFECFIQTGSPINEETGCTYIHYNKITASYFHI